MTGTDQMESAAEEFDSWLSMVSMLCISSKLSSTKENLQIVSMQMTIPQKRISQNTHNILINECQKGTYFIVVNEEILKHYDFLNKLLLFCNILLPHKLKPTIIIIKYNIGCESNNVFSPLPLYSIHGL